MSNIYLTTTLPYVNDRPHIGFALEIVQADALARFHRLAGDTVFFNFGTDEHGQKIYQKALEEEKDPKVYVDEYAATFQELKQALDLSYDVFIRTTDPHHVAAAQEFWQRCAANIGPDGPDIYKKKYRIKYCVGCELEKTDSELVDGRCPLHPNLEIQIIEEENHFFRLSRYQGKLLELYNEKNNFLVPDFRLNEIRNLIVHEGLQDFSISRLKTKLPWGVPVPDDPEQVMYVWFDALINYISTLGWPEDEKKFRAFWPGIQFAGKDQVRQQAAMWQAMLLSAGLPTTKQIFIHGFINVGGQKMSKSLGNVISPHELIQRYGTEATRYQLLKNIHPYEDTDITWERLDEWYNADLANGIGNVTARVMQMAETHLTAPVQPGETLDFPGEYKQLMQKFRWDQVLDTFVMLPIKSIDQRIAAETPYKLVQSSPDLGRQKIKELVVELYKIGRFLDPFMPKTSEKIKAAIFANKKPKTLFPRLDT